MITHWFESWPNANLGLVTGAVSDLVVIDLDNDEARLKLKGMLGDFDLSAIPRSRTGKGWQLFFKHPEATISNRAGVIPGLDVRGDGGYVVAPPSIHPNGKQYIWEVPINGHLPKLPVELFKLISSPTSNGVRERFNTAGALRGVPEGQRDQMLFKLACKLQKCGRAAGHCQDANS
jgi:Bifunctional DNA primase/polymerase, N-terminal